MRKKVIGFLNVLMGSFLGVFLGMSVYRLWDYYTHPDYYVMQSAPWYTSILLWGIATTAVLVIASIIKVLLKRLPEH